MGPIRFVDLAQGTYNIHVYPKGSRIDGLELDGTNQHEVELAVDGWGYTITHEPIDAAGNRESEETASTVADVIRCVVDGHKNLPVQARALSWTSEIMLTGSAPQYGEFACLISILNAKQTVARGESETTPNPMPDPTAASSQIEQLLEQDDAGALEAEPIETAEAETIETERIETESASVESFGGLSADDPTADISPKRTRLREFVVSVDGVVDADGESVFLEARVQLESGKVPVVTFVHNESRALPQRQRSRIVGNVATPDSFTHSLDLLLTDSQAHQRMGAVDADGSFCVHRSGAGPICGGDCWVRNDNHPFGHRARRQQRGKARSGHSGASYSPRRRYGSGEIG